MATDYQNLFKTLQTREINNAIQPGAPAGNEYVLQKLQPGCNYTFRLLWLPPIEGCNREYPMITQMVHAYFAKNHVGNPIGDKQYDHVCCPTSQYILGESREAFRKCPICAETSRLYRKYNETKSQSAFDMWKEYRRACNGYIPVYVVSGPDDCVGQVRILKYSKQIKEFFDRKIFGRVSTKKNKDGSEPQPINPDEIIGLEAFMYLQDDTVITTGYNFILSVSSKMMPIDGKNVDMKQYDTDFSRKPSVITAFGNEKITPEYFKSLNAKMRFDEEFYKFSSDAELQKFYTTYLVAGDAEVDNNVPEKLEIPAKKTFEISKDSTPVLDDEEDVVPSNDESISTNTTSVETDSSDDIDVDALIQGL